ncbi:MAG: hypothetical protein AAGD43_06700 [Pseudomonadota bacterium]
MKDTRYRECMAEVVAVLKKYDMGGHVIVVSKERVMFKWHFPKWTALRITPRGFHFQAKRKDYPSAEAHREAKELSGHFLFQTRDVMTMHLRALLPFCATLTADHGFEHEGGEDFDPELDN